MKIKEIIFAITIFALTVFLRGYDIENKFSFNAEYNYKLWPIKEIIYDHKIRLIGIEAVSYLHHLHYPPLALYIFAPILWISDGNPLSIEIALIILSGSTSILLFYLAKKVFNKKVATLAAVIYAVSFYVQTIDRFIWVVGTMMFFTTAFLYLLVKIFEQKNHKNVYLLLLATGLLVGLSLNFHFQATVLVITSLVYIYHIFKKKLPAYGYFLAGLMIPLFPLLVFELRHSFYNLNGFIILLKDSGDLLKSSSYNIAERFFSPFLKIMMGIIIPQTLLDKMHLIIPLIIFLLVIFVFIFRKSKTTKPQKQFLIVCLLLITLGFLTFPFVQNRFYRTDYYLYFLAPVFIVFLSFALIELVKLRGAFGLIILSAGIFLMVINLKESLLLKSNFAWKDQKLAIEYIIMESPDTDYRIKFTDFASEEIDYLFYYLSIKTGKEYGKIHYVEAWQNDGNLQFLITAKPQDAKKSKQFDGIYITKIY